jgi:hypothetical protein
MGTMTPEKLTEWLDRGLAPDDKQLQTALVMGKENGPAMAKILLERGAVPSEDTIALAGMSGDASLALAMKKARESLSPEAKAQVEAGEQAKEVAEAKENLDKTTMGIAPVWAVAGLIKISDRGRQILNTTKEVATTGSVTVNSTYFEALSGARYALDDGEWADWPLKEDKSRSLADKKHAFDIFNVAGKHEMLKVKLIYADGTESSERSYLVNAGDVK